MPKVVEYQSRNRRSPSGTAVAAQVDLSVSFHHYALSEAMVMQSHQLELQRNKEVFFAHIHQYGFKMFGTIEYSFAQSKDYLII